METNEEEGGLLATLFGGGSMVFVYILIPIGVTWLHYYIANQTLRFYQGQSPLDDDKEKVKYPVAIAVAVPITWWWARIVTDPSFVHLVVTDTSILVMLFAAVIVLPVVGPWLIFMIAVIELKREHGSPYNNHRD